MGKTANIVILVLLVAGFTSMYSYFTEDDIGVKTMYLVETSCSFIFANLIMIYEKINKLSKKVEG